MDRWPLYAILTHGKNLWTTPCIQLSNPESCNGCPVPPWGNRPEAISNVRVWKLRKTSENYEKWQLNVVERFVLAGGVRVKDG